MTSHEKDRRGRPFVVAPDGEESLAETLAAERTARHEAERESPFQDEFFAALGHEYAPKPIDPPLLLRELSRLWRRGAISTQHDE